MCERVYVNVSVCVCECVRKCVSVYVWKSVCVYVRVCESIVNVSVCV